VCALLGERLDTESELGRRIAAWPGRPVADALPLRAAGALHALVRSGRAPALAALYPPALIPEPDALWRALEAAITAHDATLCAGLDSPPQTNEVARSSVLLAAALTIAEQTGLPLAWHEIGASAGLNLGFDGYRYELGRQTFGAADQSVVIRSEWQSERPSTATPLRVIARSGCDVRPLDPGSAADRERLMSYVWPDQTERLQRLASALQAAAAAAWRVERAPASAWLRRCLQPAAVPGIARVVAHTIVWQYLPREERTAVSEVMASAALSASAEAPLAWFAMEGDGRQDSAALHLTVWPGGERRAVGRADFHGRWVRWEG
jgi:hypothetical protein